MSSDTITTPTLAQVIRRVFDLRLRDVHTALPAKVDSYDADKQTVDATPQVQLYTREEDGTDVAKPLPRITKCPVVFPGAGGFRLTFPIQQGDTVLLVFAESSIDLWLKNGDNADPKDDRRHHLSDAIALPGLNASTTPWSKASTSGLTIGKDGGPQIVFRDDVIELGGDDSDTPSDNVALAKLVKDEMKKLHDTLKGVTDSLSTAYTSISAHTHTVAASTLIAAPSVALASLSAPAGPSDVGDVKSDKLKAK